MLTNVQKSDKIVFSTFQLEYLDEILLMLLLNVTKLRLFIYWFYMYLVLDGNYICDMCVPYQ